MSNNDRVPQRGMRLGTELAQIADQLIVLARGQNRLHELYEAVISRDQDLSDVLRLIARTAMDLVEARYGALGVLDDRGERLRELIPLGLSETQVRALSGTDMPTGRGLLGQLIAHPEPMRVKDIAAHPAAVGFPAGHPPMRSMVGAAVSIRGRVYGNLYLCERKDSRPFDAHDEAMIAAFAEAAGLAIDDAALMRQTRLDAEHFQRMLLPRLSDVRPLLSASVYRPASAPRHIGGDWYDAIPLPTGAVAAVIGDVVGHDLQAAAAMAQIRNMLLAHLHYAPAAEPAETLTALDHTVEDLTRNPVTTLCLARFEPETDTVGANTGRFRMRWSTAGHPPAAPAHPRHRLPLPSRTARPTPRCRQHDAPSRPHPFTAPPSSTVIFYTDGLTEHPQRPIDQTMSQLADKAGQLNRLSLQEILETLADQHPSDGHDDMALLAIRIPPHP
ncbi:MULTISPECIES: PP2C family protein-serine/threonine phosphatase [Streptomyces]|uniref:SpoIIE family protein phosphatase n=1 Tax=Streptomyces doudnae TaxID=3075536 RepID=A0ABD5EWF4_9ACTN|nr:MULTISPECIES: GAF domain-containing SpoIIE family protein phosphatase [unclassified Streptomyces]MDT0438660.1 SpoIIE family protein phosphatase [Streptomyces sp. DSM 41981]SCD29673.1 Serine phosphatase RsbU, regulator of sigma subunit [Streptomyces sp. SolWspMP-5a-2]